MRMSRFLKGRTFAAEQVSLFREDVEDLMSVPMVKAPIYVLPMAMTCSYCVTVLVEGRSGLKFPAPPTFASGLYLQCLCIGFAFMTIGIWLAYHAAFRAHIGAVQLRTRKVRVPVPTQRQIDGARKISADWELQSAYDQFRLPFIMPHMRQDPTIDDSKLEGQKGDKKWKAVRAPGLQGMQTWNYASAQMRKTFPNASDVVPGMGSCPVVPENEPLEHFEYVRSVQKEYWSCETYMRVCFLFGKMHLIQAFNYWLVIHIISELALVWCANICAVALTTTLWLIWHLDILPERGGAYPLEAAGPNIACVTLSLQYAATPSQTILDCSRALAMITLVMQILWTFRLYMVARPANEYVGDNIAKESGGLAANQSGACDVPSWLPAAFQPVQYLVAPPKPTPKDGKPMKEDDSNVDMKGWTVVRAVLITTLVMWFVLLAGRIVESVSGERMIVSQPGNPPWTRIGLWSGWEWGPITSKHYAHVTPARGHFGWDEGHGPAGTQEIWPSDLFGFHPEADAHWRRLRSAPMEDVARAVVPAAVSWPNLFEPELLACAPASVGGQVAAFTSNGYGAVVPAHAAKGAGSAAAQNTTLSGLETLGQLRGLSWSENALWVVAGSGSVARCSVPKNQQAVWECTSAEDVPRVPLTSSEYELPLAVVAEGNQTGLLAAVSETFGEVTIFHLHNDAHPKWEVFTKVMLPSSGAVSQQVASLQMSSRTLQVTGVDGVVHQWQITGDTLLPKLKQEAPASSSGVSARTWRAACEMPDGKFVRLASRWRRTKERALVWQPELLV
eukprot:CAMPEP_0178426730 /NCGR_PEP_ID=MMETSP0689_2-20121128/29383_1 /TAXON_ID=160604 /ORGANISM="Amphidinium massartii, Strain CS-259" /LENGTH=786 /DNA_ID=CAMNT_0020048421 /DNA_START=88 /DNA_END=2448 /DNA_ORIENTATION=+